MAFLALADTIEDPIAKGLPMTVFLHVFKDEGNTKLQLDATPGAGIVWIPYDTTAISLHLFGRYKDRWLRIDCHENNEMYFTPNLKLPYTKQHIAYRQSIDYNAVFGELWDLWAFGKLYTIVSEDSLRLDESWGYIFRDR